MLLSVWLLREVGFCLRDLPLLLQNLLFIIHQVLQLPLLQQKDQILLQLPLQYRLLRWRSSPLQNLQLYLPLLRYIRNQVHILPQLQL